MPEYPGGFALPPAALELSPPAVELPFPAAAVLLAAGGDFPPAASSP